MSGYLEWLKQDGVKGGESKFDEIVTSNLDEIRQIIASTIKHPYLNRQHENAQIPGLNFHRGANLLVVIGTRESVDIARKIISALPGGPGHAAATNFSADGGDGWANPAPSSTLTPGSNFRERLKVTLPPAPSSTQSAEEAFRRRFGLAPGTSTGPNGPPPVQPQKK
jgi:hypothetical protein